MLLQIVAANVGDARAVYRAPTGSVVTLTADHRCANEAERRWATLSC
jgi:serine/threonine protein phosphatase PrpC